MFRHLKTGFLLSGCLLVINGLFAPIVNAADTATDNINMEQMDAWGLSYYSREQSSACPPKDGSPNTSVPTGSTTGETVYKFLLSKGLTAKQALGIVANLSQESGGGTLNLNTEANNGTHYGIAQWGGNRLANLRSFAQKQGKDASDIGVQANFIWEEISTTYKSSVLEPLKATATVSDAILVWLEHYEIPCSIGHCQEEQSRRTSIANQLGPGLTGLSAADIGASSTTTCTTTSSTTVSSDGWTWPTKTHNITQDWNAQSAYGYHPAIDIGAPVGAPVYAAHDGEVVYSNVNECSSGFFKVRVSASGQTIYMFYAHTKSAPAVGTKLKAGEQIGTITNLDNTPCIQGAHLHFGISKSQNDIAGGQYGYGPTSQSVIDATFDPKTILPKDSSL